MRKLIGVLNKSTVGLSQWEVQETGILGDVEVGGIVPLNKDTVWASVEPNVTMRTTDGGSNWSVKTVTGASGLRRSGISAINANTAWVSMYDPSGATSGGIFKTSDGGDTWTQQTTAFPGSGGFPNLVYFFDADNGLALGDPNINDGYFEFYTTGDGGTNWERVPEDSIPPVLSVVEYGFFSEYSARGDTAWYPTVEGRVYRTTNRGMSWSVSATGLEGSVSCDFKDASNGLAISVDSPDLTARSSDGGETWTLVNSPPPIRRFLSYVPGTTGSYVTGWFLGSAFTLDDGLTWIQIDDAAHVSPEFVSSTIGWIGSWTGLLYTYSGPPLEEGASLALDSLEVSETYDVPGSEQALVAYMRIFEESYSLFAEIMAVDTSKVDTVALADDGLHNDGDAGDDIWGGSWLTDPVETTYRMNLFSPDYYVWDYNTVHFTTIGPVLYEELTFLTDSIPNPGDNLIFRIGLRNDGSATTATTVTVELTSTDPCVVSLGALGNLSYDDIEPGETSTTSGAFTLEINETCPVETDIPFQISIASDGHIFWSDSFTIHVYESLDVTDEGSALPEVFALHQNYPNPFNPVTTLKYDLPEGSEVTLTIYDILGRRVRTLARGVEEPGHKSVMWDGNDDLGEQVSAGVYLYRIKAGDFTQTRKMLLLK